MRTILYKISLFLAIVAQMSCGITFKDSFNHSKGSLPDEYWSEGCSGQIEDGHLFVDADNFAPYQSTIWLDKELSGDLLIECDVHIISSKDTADNINFMFMYSDPAGRSLKATRSERSSGSYETYQKLNGYIFTYLANGRPDTARFRFRYNPGFKLLQEVNGYECRTGITYHIKFMKKGNHFQFLTNDFRAIDIDIDGNYSVYDKGYFGFRTWHTEVWWDNLIIKNI